MQMSWAEQLCSFVFVVELPSPMEKMQGDSTAIHIPFICLPSNCIIRHPLHHHR